MTTLISPRLHSDNWDYKRPRVLTVHIVIGVNDCTDATTEDDVASHDLPNFTVDAAVSFTSI